MIRIKEAMFIASAIAGGDSIREAYDAFVDAIMPGQVKSANKAFLERARDMMDSMSGKAFKLSGGKAIIVDVNEHRENMERSAEVLRRERLKRG